MPAKPSELCGCAGISRRRGIIRNLRIASLPGRNLQSKLQDVADIHSVGVCNVVVIALSRLRDFWATYPDAETSLRVWYKATLAAGWANFANIRATFGNASAVGNCVVFNIAGTKYRLVTRVRYRIRTVFVLRVMTHPVYDNQEQWQAECGCHKPPPPYPARQQKKSPSKRRK